MKKLLYIPIFVTLGFSHAYAQTLAPSNPQTPPSPSADSTPVPPSSNQTLSTDKAAPETPKTTMDNPENTTNADEPSKLEELQKKVFSLQGQLSDLNIYLSNLQVQLNELINKNDNNTPLSEREAKIQALQQKLMETDTNLKAMKEELEKLDGELQSLKGEAPTTGSNNKDALKPEENVKDIPKDLTDLEKRIASLEDEVKKLSSGNGNADDNKTNEVEETQVLEQKLEPEIKNGDASVQNDQSVVKIKLNGNILFRDGEVSISNVGQNTLKKIAPVLSALKDKLVFVVGHADTKPIGPNLRDFYPTNWELSTTRGTMVARYLQSLGVSPSTLTAAGRSFYEPSQDGKDRRVEIWIFPKLLSESKPLDSQS